MATQDQRQHALAVMQWLIAHKSLIGYSQARPMATAHLFEQDLATKFGKGESIAPDCSEAVTLMCRYAGLKDPNGMGFDGFGNSATMFDHLGHYTNPANAHLGAIVVFGVGGAEHAAMVMEPGTDPTLFSHGSAAGPIGISLSELTSAIGGPVTFLDVGSL